MPGKPATLQDRILFFANTVVKNKNARKKLKQLWESELELYKSKSDGTIKLYVSKYRSMIKDKLGEDFKNLDIFTTPTDIVKRVKAKYTDKIVYDHNNLIAVDNWEAIVQKGSELIGINEPFSLITGLLILTGRRTSEICISGNFKPMNAFGNKYAIEKYALSFTGQLKTRNAEGTRRSWYKIPTIHLAKDIIQAHKKLRQYRDEFIQYDENLSDPKPVLKTNVRAQLLEFVTEQIAPYFPGKISSSITPHDLRALYAEILYTNIGSKTRLSKNAYFAKILGHGSNDIQTSLSYMRFYLPDNQFNRINQKAFKSIQLAQKRAAEIQQQYT